VRGRLLREEAALDEHLDRHPVEVDGGVGDGSVGIGRVLRPGADLGADPVRRLLQFIERPALPSRDGLGEPVEGDWSSRLQVVRDVITHEDDGSAVAAWVACDPILARVEWPIVGPRACLVGGAVRDAILGVPHGPDVDVVVEGDAIAVATRIGHDLGGRVITHERFRTARVEFAHGRHLDLASARRETYARPGALPDVSPGGLADDLARRDFTVNAIAFVLHGDGAGEIIDPHGGRADIRAERIRSLRADAFHEDPSRVVRALRYAARLGFRMEDGTESAARRAAAEVSLAHSRVADELARLLAEDAAPVALAMGAALGLAWPDADPRRADRLAALEVALTRAGAPGVTPWALRLGLGIDPVAVEDAALPAWSRAVAREVRDGLERAPAVSAARRPSEVDDLLGDLPPAAQIGVLVGGAEAVATWWARWRDLAPEVGGSDLVAAGVAPGPGIGRALRAVRRAVLDGRATGRDEEMAVALAEAGRSA